MKYKLGDGVTVERADIYVYGIFTQTDQIGLPVLQGQRVAEGSKIGVQAPSELRGVLSPGFFIRLRHERGSARSGGQAVQITGDRLAAELLDLLVQFPGLG